jgi:hypothetical protein
VGKAEDLQTVGTKIEVPPAQKGAHFTCVEFFDFSVAKGADGILFEIIFDGYHLFSPFFRLLFSEHS